MTDPWVAEAMGFIRGMGLPVNPADRILQDLLSASHWRPDVDFDKDQVKRALAEMVRRAKAKPVPVAAFSGLLVSQDVEMVLAALTAAGSSTEQPKPPGARSANAYTPDPGVRAKAHWGKAETLRASAALHSTRPDSRKALLDSADKHQAEAERLEALDE